MQIECLKDIRSHIFFADLVKRYNGKDIWWSSKGRCNRTLWSLWGGRK